MRLPFFPVPAEGEAIFSVVGRCAERLGISNRELMTIMTGQRYVTTLFSPLPGYLSKIASAMPSGHPWQDISELINKHTALPYFTYFHPNDKRLLNLNSLAKAENSQPLIVGMGLTMYRTPVAPKSPRFCVQCIIEQTENFGFTYFHLAHQLPGVTVCWKHNEILYDGCIHCGSYPLPRKKLTMPGQCLCPSFKAKVVSIQPITEGAKWLARNSAHILTHNLSEDNPIEKLRNVILQSGFRRGSLVDYFRLAEAIEYQLGNQLLSTINYPALKDGKPSAWLRRYFSHGKSGRQLPTIAGLLISSAVLENIQDFCSNKAFSQNTEHCKKTTVNTGPPEKWKTSLERTLINHSFRISSCAATINKTPWAVAIAARDQNISIPLSSDTIKRLGNKRLNQIILELHDGAQKKQILKKHQISEWTLLLIELSDSELRRTQKQKAADIVLQRHRRVVTDLTQNNPSITRTGIMNNFPGTYDFLINKDKSWFQETIPIAPRKYVKSNIARLNWKNIDTLLSIDITEATEQLRNIDAKPVRITASALLSQRGELQRYTTQPSKFPKTRKALDRVVESPEQYLWRKISWGIKQLIFTDEEISINNLRRKCSVPASKLHPHLDEIRTLINNHGGQISKKSKLFKCEPHKQIITTPSQ